MTRKFSWKNHMGFFPIIPGYDMDMAGDFTHKKVKHRIRHYTWPILKYPCIMGPFQMGCAPNHN